MALLPTPHQTVAKPGCATANHEAISWKHEAINAEQQGKRPFVAIETITGFLCNTILCLKRKRRRCFVVTPTDVSSSHINLLIFIFAILIPYKT